MADISSITIQNGDVYDLKDTVARSYHHLTPIATKTYTDVIATTDDNVGAGFFYLKYRGTAYNSYWHIITRVIAEVPGYPDYHTDTIFDIHGYKNTYSWYACLNRIKSTSYRPIYYNSHFRVSETGYNNGCGGWIGFNLVSSTNNLNTSYKRTIEVQVLWAENCTTELQDSLVTSTNIPNRAAHTNWYSSTDTSFDNFDACNYGLKQTGDANTTNITNVYRGNGSLIADSALYRYQLIFQKDENTFTPLNNNKNTTSDTKTMLTDVEFDPFGFIYYYATTTDIAAGGSIGAGALYWAFNGIDLRYTLNCNQTMTAHKPIYLVVNPQSNGMCKLDATTQWTNALPNTADGKWYILLGRTYSTYQIVLYHTHPVYYHDGTTIRMVSGKIPASPSSATPQPLGTAAAGSSDDYSRADHVHAKPTYSKTDVGLSNVDNVQQYSASNPPPYPVTSVNGSTGAVSITVPTKTSDLTNDSDFITGLTILKYGSSTWADFIAAYNAKKVVYCRASSNANPATGAQTRLAFMAYVNDETSPTNVEFQYYRSVSSHSNNQQGDQTYIYKLDQTAGWTVTVRENYTKIAVNTSGLSGTWSNGTYTIANTKTTAASVGAIAAPSSASSGDILTYDGSAWGASSPPTIPSASATVPMRDDLTGSAGSADEYARADHVHPISTDLTIGVELQYKLSTSSEDPYEGDTLPQDPTDEDLDEFWSTIAPALETTSQYLWQRAVITYIDASIVRGSPSCISTITERVEVSTNIANLSNEYYLSTSSAEPTGGAWSSSVPSLSPGHYIWTRIKLETTDGASSYTDPMLHDALNSIATILDENNTAIENQISDLSDDISDVGGSVTEINDWIATGAITKPDGTSTQGVKITKSDGSTPYAAIFTSGATEVYDGTDKLLAVNNKKVNTSATRANSVELASSPFSGDSSEWKIGTSTSGFTIKWIGG